MYSVQLLQDNLCNSEDSGFQSVISLVHRPTQLLSTVTENWPRGLGTKLVLHSSQYLVQFSDFASNLEYQLLSC